MENYPRICHGHGSVVAEFAPAFERRRDLPLKMVLDFDRSGEIIGIEVINLLLTVGPRALEVVKTAVPMGGDRLRFAYDEESDCFYLRLSCGTSADQKSVEGLARLDEDGRIISLTAEWES